MNLLTYTCTYKRIQPLKPQIIQLPHLDISKVPLTFSTFTFTKHSPNTQVCFPAMFTDVRKPFLPAKILLSHSTPVRISWGCLDNADGFKWTRIFNLNSAVTKNILRLLSVAYRSWRKKVKVVATDGKNRVTEPLRSLKMKMSSKPMSIEVGAVGLRS